MDLLIRNVPERQVARLRQLAKANQRSLQEELRAIIHQATRMVPKGLRVDEILPRVSRLGLKRRNEAARLIREDRDR